MNRRLDRILRLLLLGLFAVMLTLIVVEIGTAASNAYLERMEPTISPVCRDQFGHRDYCTLEAYQ